ncbi:TetR/AcrR family transcriptional regulator [Paenibacillus sp.]|jgi:AcrR family transcriptional regulator|uniref:TetR/AcrR family transcriptional regulator n=1 Tax=Paenibacillus sp. TaxID=58172 RepID=UPI00282312C6|nr:TetR/AcrR family transcriptional regulator [Paenibacillus sp.]MDR0267434.1 TetR/AcrR family transcriptional regulator [Paenibacillus sp.]
MSPRTKKQNEIIREQRKQEILQAAIQVYVTKGYSAANLSDIANQAGLAHGLVYYYFKNKKGLFRELYECMMDRSLEYTTSYFEQDAPVLEQFKNYSLVVCERVIKDPEAQLFYMRISLDLHHLYEPGKFPPFEWMKNFIKPMAQAIDKGIQEGVIRQGDAYLMAMQFWGAVSQGMSYLDQLLQELSAQGLTEKEKNNVISEKIQQIAGSAVSFFKSS